MAVNVVLALVLALHACCALSLAVTIAPGPTVASLLLFDEAIFPEARCNDGTRTTLNLTLNLKRSRNRIPQSN